jgi:hypothetical protein
MRHNAYEAGVKPAQLQARSSNVSERSQPEVGRQQLFVLGQFRTEFYLIKMSCFDLM